MCTPLERGQLRLKLAGPCSAAADLAGSRKSRSERQLLVFPVATDTPAPLCLPSQRPLQRLTGCGYCGKGSFKDSTGCVLPA